MTCGNGEYKEETHFQMGMEDSGVSRVALATGIPLSESLLFSLWSGLKGRKQFFSIADDCIYLSMQKDIWAPK